MQSKPPKIYEDDPKEVELVPTWRHHPDTLVSLVQGGTLQATEREMLTSS